VVVNFVDIFGIVDHHCHFSKLWKWKKKLSGRNIVRYTI